MTEEIRPWNRANLLDWRAFAVGENRLGMAPHIQWIGKARNGHSLWLFLLTMTAQRDVKRW